MSDILETVLLLALPASGKSEVRKYLDWLPPEECRRDFHMGPTVQLDDFPYVHMMRRIDDELEAQGQKRLFFQSPEKPFSDTRDWLTLIELINEDYEDLLEKKPCAPRSVAAWIIERIEAAAKLAGAPVRLASLPDNVRTKLCDKIEREAAELLADKLRGYPDTLDGKTLVIEFARGGPQGSTMPLPEFYGYRHSLGRLSERILEKSVVLYIWVTPEESRRKNEARADPNDPGSILHHGVPIDVMLGDYGCDDLDWLEQEADKEGTLTIEAYGRKFHLPIARFDNRVDKTSFIRKDADKWEEEEISALHDGLKAALDKLAANYIKT
jgi:hypothetical protein